jgi:hypothetical protein
MIWTALPVYRYARLCVWIGLVRIVCLHRIWPYIWWFPCQKYRTYTVFIYIWFWPTLRMNHAHLPCASVMRISHARCVSCAWPIPASGSATLAAVHVCAYFTLPWPIFASGTKLAAVHICARSTQPFSILNQKQNDGNGEGQGVCIAFIIWLNLACSLR